MQQGEQLRNQRPNTQRSGQVAAMEGDPPKMAGTMETFPVEAEGLPDPVDETGRQPHNRRVAAQTRRTACAL